jgi:hypothetical protein
MIMGTENRTQIGCECECQSECKSERAVKSEIESKHECDSDGHWILNFSAKGKSNAAEAAHVNATLKSRAKLKLKLNVHVMSI